MPSLAGALSQPGLSAIAEFKRRSPSAGDLRPDADAAEVVYGYERAGAAAASVLIDERFGGSWGDLVAARRASRLPLLAKGFFKTEAELETARDSGADAVLLLLRDLDDASISSLMGAAAALGLDSLVEAHDAAELERAVALGAAVIGINARDLTTFAIDRQTQLELVASAPRDRVIVAESGITTRMEAVDAELAGADAVLIGSALMCASDPAAKLREVMLRPLVKVCGLTRQEDVDAAAAAAADLLGFILAAESPRRAPRVLDVPAEARSVAVCVGEVPDAALAADLVQLYHREGAHRGRDGVLLWQGETVAQVRDLPWREDDPEHWQKAALTVGRVMLAGRLGADNVADAIRTVRPWAVDAASRLESAPGVKDHELVRAYITVAREAL